MLALLCAGQGHVGPDMFALVADAPAAQPILSTAGNVLGQDPRILVQSGQTDAVSANRANQILSVTAALALHACIADCLPEPFAVTGYSVGEMAAWSIAGIWTAAEAMHVTDHRARAMDQASDRPGRLIYVRGLSRNRLTPLADQQGYAVAIVNPGDLFILGGPADAAATLCAAALAAGAAQATPLAVQIAAHTPLLHEAVPIFFAALTASPLQDPASGRRLISGGNRTRIFQTHRAIAQLAAQIAEPIDWAASLDALVESRVTHCLDLGPGHALADMMQGAHPGIQTYAATQFRSLEGLRAWLASVSASNR